MTRVRPARANSDQSVRESIRESRHDPSPNPPRMITKQSSKKKNLSVSSSSRKGSSMLAPLFSTTPEATSRLQSPGSRPTSRRSTSGRKRSSRLSIIAADVGNLKRKSLEVLNDGFATLKQTLTNGPTKRDMSIVGPSFSLPAPTMTPPKRKHRPFVAKLARLYAKFETKISRDAVVALEALQLFYIGFSVPFRLALLFDPYSDVPVLPQHMMFALLAVDILSDTVALIAALGTLKGTVQPSAVVPLTSSDPSFSRKEHHRNSAFQQSLVKFALARQQTMRRNSTFLMNETFMKPQYLLSSAWDKTKVVMAYHIIVEWFALFPFELACIGHLSWLPLARLPKMLRLFKAGEISRLIKHTLAEHELLAGFHNIGMSLLMGVAFSSLVLMHWVACMFLFSEHLQCGYNLDHFTEFETCWARKANLQSASLFRQYVYTMVVVGYGFPVPQTNFERAFAILIQFMRFCIAGGIIGAFVFLFECQNRQVNEFHDQVDGVKEYLVARRLSKQIQTKVLDFYEHFWNAQRGIDEDTIISTLPLHIQTQCLELLRAKLLKTVPIFRLQPIPVLNRLMLRMKRQCYGRYDWVLRFEPCKVLFMVCRGRIAVLDKFDAITKNVVDGQHFGLSMMQETSDEVISARAETICDLYTLDKQSVQEVYKRCAQHISVPWAELVSEATRIAQKPIRANSKLGLGKKFTEENSTTEKWCHPDSRFRQHWEQCVVVVLVYLTIDIPIHICFETHFSMPLFIWRLLLDVFLFADLVFRCRYFAYIEKGNLISDPWFIWQEYKHNGFLLDALSNIPFALVADCLQQNESPLLFVVRVCEWIRFLQMRRLMSTLSNVLKQFQVNDTTYIIVNMIFCVPFACHIGGCIWYWIAAFSISHHQEFDHDTLTLDNCLEWARDYQNCTWLLFDHAHFGQSSDYVRAFYWSVVSLVTVQFGSIQPFTDVECGYMFLFLYISSVANFGAVGALANAVTRINWETSQKQKQVAIAHRLMNLEGVSRSVRLDVSNYYKHHWTQATEQQALSVLKPLPDNLRQEIQSFLHEKSVSHLTIFKVIDSDGLRFIYSIMRHQSYKRNEYIVRAGNSCDNIYVLTRGIMESLYCVNDMNVPIQLLFPGDCLGEATFVQKRTFDLSVRVVSESADVSVLNRHDFAAISAHFNGLWPQVELLAQDLEKLEKQTLTMFDINLRKPNIYRTLNQCSTLYKEPMLEGRLIRPGSFAYRVWELLIGVVVIYNLIQIPFRIALYPTPSDNAMIILSSVDIICDLVFLIDMFIKYNHLIIVDKNGDEVVSVHLIRRNYLHGAFKVEVICSLPMYYVGNYRTMTLCRLPRLLRCYQISNLLRSFHTFVQEQTSSSRVSQVFEFVKLLLALVLSSHLAATGLYLTSYSEYHSHMESANNATESVHAPEVWFEGDRVIAEHPHSVGIIYIRAFYWGLGVLSSFDYMDMEMSMVGETLWFCAVALSGVFFIGVVIGEVSAAIFNANKEIREVELKLENFAFYAKTKRLPAFMIRRAKLFFQFQLDCNMGMDADSIFCDLPQVLRLELYKDMYTKLLTPIPLFSTLTVAQINYIAERLQTKLYLPGDDIIMEGDVGNCLYVMKQGLAEKYLHSCKLILAAVYTGNLFGELGFFLSTRYNHGVRAVKCSEVLVLERTDWMEAWSNEVGLKFKVKMAVAVQKEHDIMEYITASLKKNFGLGGHAPMKLTSMLGIKRTQTNKLKVPPKHHDHGGRNLFNYLRETSKFAGKNIPHLSQFAPAHEISIWEFGYPPRASCLPESLFREVWDMVMLGITLYYVSVLPFRACFVDIPRPAPLWIIIWFSGEYIMDSFSLVDFVLRSHFFYVFAFGEMQTNRDVLLKHYKKHGQYIPDIIASIPFELIAFALPQANVWYIASVCRLNRMMRLVHLPHLAASLRHILSHQKWFPPYKMHFQCLVSFIVPFFLIAHWIACLWFSVTYVTREADSPSWLVSGGYISLKDSYDTDEHISLGFSETIKFTSFNVYLASLYYAVSSLTSQSFADIFSRNVLETWLTICIMLLSIALYGVLVGVLSEMMQDRLNPRASFEQHMVDISTFFNYRLLPFDFFIQTSRFSRTQWQNNMGRTENDFLSVLSTTIREDIAMYVKQNVVKTLKFLNTCEEVFARALVTKLHTEEYIHADVVYQFGDVGRVLYFIEVGSVSLVSSSVGVQNRASHEHFGGVSLFDDRGRTVTAIANVDCTMFLLYFDDFQRLIDRFPEYRERCFNQWYILDEHTMPKFVPAARRPTKQPSQNSVTSQNGGLPQGSPTIPSR
ncbi:Aste57867_22014 [Aphanomyces stellatus]|uniref:Aste57867_22014 protein n=1 Tax=Aphanomyces stellatus TaxID=120398 RepID=A0A485LL43_9STRA|nr:hypothetical protein As57867_021945 [Aphanomyces stellatus]VFT98682.1 Aste57867_22014 [Aphanomyces stellatus]